MKVRRLTTKRHETHAHGASPRASAETLPTEPSLTRLRSADDDAEAEAVERRVRDFKAEVEREAEVGAEHACSARLPSWLRGLSGREVYELCSQGEAEGEGPGTDARLQQAAEEDRVQK